MSDNTTKQMQPEEITQFLQGKTIQSVQMGQYLDWVVIDELTTEDGWIVSFGGNADVAYIWWIEGPNGQHIAPIIDESKAPQ